jgi:hypothetical protein
MAGEAPGVVTSAPVVPAADAAPEIQSTADGITDAPEGGEQPEATPEKTLTQSEVNKLIAKEKAKESRRVERAIRAEAERDLLRQQLEQRNRPEPAASPGKPQPKDFSDWESYNEALTDWKVEQRLGKMRDESTAQHHQRQAREAEAQLARTINDNFKAAAEKYPDFVEVVTADGLPFHHGSPILAYLAKSKAGGEIAYHLGNDRAEADRIAQMHPIDQVLTLRDLEAKLTAPPRPTNTSAPIVPNRGSSSGSKSMLDMSQEEFEKHRKARLAKR